MKDEVRLSKLMADKGLCSRREADRLIAGGLVKVNGVVVSQLGSKVARDAQIELLKEGARQLEELVTFVINKPVGWVSGQAEKGYRPAAALLRPENQSSLYRQSPLRKKHFEGLAPAGRLDIDSQGLLILTQDGSLARQIIGENSKLEKEYLVRIEGQVTSETLKRLRFGLQLDGQPLKRAQVEQLNPDQLRFVLKQGKKRQIRRMCELVGLRVTGLKRVRIGGLLLGRLQEGQWRFLRRSERRLLLDPDQKSLSSS